MSERIQAAVLYGKESMRIERIETRPLQPGEVRLRVEAALTCGTDLKVFKRGYHARMIVPPSVFGHEMAGVIVERREGSGESEDENEWQVGDRVVAANSAPCGSCPHCRVGQQNLCDDLLFLNGAYAESVVVPERIVRKNMLRLKARTAFRDAALVEPLACVVQGLDDLRLRAGERVLVIGAGPIGLMFAALAASMECPTSVAGRGQARLDCARRLGVERVLEVERQGDMVQQIKSASSSVFDVVIEAVGKPETWEAAVQLVRKGGRVNFFGGCPSGTTVTLDTGLLHYSNITLHASFHHTPRTVLRALQLIEHGVINAGDFIDGECPLSRLPELFRSMADGNHAIKTFVRVHE